jgi:hypothetical protein
MRACGTFAKPATFRSLPRETRKHRNGCLVVAPATMPASGSTASRFETGTAAPRVCVEEIRFIAKTSTRRGPWSLVFIYMDCGPTIPHGGSHT